MTKDVKSWLALTPEDPILPELPICDPHHHFWDRPGDRFLLDELLGEITGSGHNITETVFVECSSMYRRRGPEHLKPVGETEFVNGIAAMSASGQYGDARVAAAIVGFADLTLGAAVREVLEAQVSASPTRFRGIRHSACWDASPEMRRYKNPPRGMMGDSTFRQGFGVLGDMGVSFEAWLYHTQLLELVDLARAFPDVTIIVNHIAGPIGIGPYAGREDEVARTWRDGMSALAACPNVLVKLGGFGMPLGGRDWHERPTPPGSAEVAKVMEPWYLHCIEQFGANRCMFESNFPVDKVSCSYTVLWNAFKHIAKEFSETEKAAVFRNTALEAYRITTD